MANVYSLRGSGGIIAYDNGNNPAGVSGVYPVTAIDTDTTGTALSIRLSYFSGAMFATATDPAVITWTQHGRSVNDPVRFSTTNTLPSPLSASTTYYIKRVLTANTFTVSTTVGGTEVACTTTGTGTHTAILYYGSPAVTAATASITLASFTVDSNVLTPNGSMECNALFGVTNSANAKRLTMTYGGTALLDTGAGSNTSVAGVNVNKAAYARGTGTIVTTAAVSLGHGTSANAVQVLSIAYNTDLTFAITTTMAVANEVTTLHAYQIALH